MRIAVVHGYFLGDSGSGVYVRNVAQALVALGHEVTLVCQEREPQRYEFIDSVWALDPSNTRLRPLAARAPMGPGSCRLVRPDLGERLLVYVDGPFAGFPREGVKAFQDAPGDWVESYLAANIAALRAAFVEWPPNLVLTHHAFAQPYVARQALGGSAPYVVTCHGSELNFTLKCDERLARYAFDGLADAAAVVAVSATSAQDAIGWAAAHDLVIADRTSVIPPGIDTERFTPAPSRRAAIDEVTAHLELPGGFKLSAEDDILAFAGRIGWTKGIQHAVAALSLVAAVRPRAKLLVAGAGPAREALTRLAALLSAGDVDGARRLAAFDPELRTTDEYGPLVPKSLAAPGGTSETVASDGAAASNEAAVGAAFGPARVAYLGHLAAPDVARVFAAADLALTPSVFPEAAALVTSEALSSGALPIVTYQSGLRQMADIEADILGDDAFRGLVPGRDLTLGLAEEIVRQLDRYPTRDAGFREAMHEVAIEHFPSWRSVAQQHIDLGLGRSGRA